MSVRARKRGELDCEGRVAGQAEEEDMRGVRAGSVRWRERKGWAEGRDAMLGSLGPERLIALE
jgi:hypothetical protein